MPSRRRKTTAHCNACKQETRHDVLAQHEEVGTSPLDPSDPSESYAWSTVWEMLKCCGCDSITIRREHSEYGQSETDYFPAMASRARPGWVTSLPDGIVEVLDEVYAALHQDTRRLAMMGARCLIDMVILDTVDDVGTFSEKMQAMEEEGLLGARNREYVEAALDAGSAAAHRGHQPTPKEVGLVMDIVENMLQAVYILGKAGEELKQSTPPRRARAKRSAATE